MQPTNEQVERSLAALRGAPPLADVAAAGVAVHLDESAVPREVDEVLSHMPDVRVDRVAEARRRLESGDTPSAQELADRMLGRLVCDRLR